MSSHDRQLVFQYLSSFYITMARESSALTQNINLSVEKIPLINSPFAEADCTQKIKERVAGTLETI